MLQGYSLTETTCTGTCMMGGDGTTGKVGAPMAGMEVKMVNWEEGHYRVSDRPRPRGEVIIGGLSSSSSSILILYLKTHTQSSSPFSSQAVPV